MSDAISGQWQSESTPEALLQQAINFIAGESRNVPDLNRITLNELIIGLRFMIESNESISPDASAIEREARRELVSAYEDAILDKERSVYGSAIVNAVWFLHASSDEKNQDHRLHSAIIDDATGTTPLTAEKLSDLLFKINYGPRLQLEERERNQLACRYAALIAIYNRTDSDQIPEELTAEIASIKKAMAQSAINRIGL